MTNGDYQRLLRLKDTEIENLKAVLKLVEWGTTGYCTNCCGSKKHNHMSGCVVADALTRSATPFKTGEVKEDGVQEVVIKDEESPT